MRWFAVSGQVSSDDEVRPANLDRCSGMPQSTQAPRRSAWAVRAAWLLLAVAVLGLSRGAALGADDPALDDGTAVTTAADGASTDAATIEARLFDAAQYLASDELEGRGIGTEGLNLAADYIADTFRALGLQTALWEDQPFQRFTMTVGAKLGETNRVALIGPADAPAGAVRQPLELERDFAPLALGSSGTFDLPLVFVGYGITAKELDYDDYEGIDVEGKAVVVLRHEPQQDNPHSAFNGTDHSVYAPFARKLSNAYEHGAAAVVFVTDEHELRNRVARRQQRWTAALEELQAERQRFAEIEAPTLAELAEHQQRVEKIAEQIRDLGARLRDEIDPVLAFNRAGEGSESREFPVLHCRRGVIDEVVQAALGTTLAELERQIDQGPAPHSAELAGWRIAGEVTVQREEAEVRNVVAVLEGAGPLAEETIVIGAHYDHLGRGGSGSLALGSSDIHNGADDNASGTAVLLEVARQLAERGQPLPRRIVFIAFTAEERGLIGSARYVRDPIVPLEQTIAMLNLDMVGRLDEEKLIVQGGDTAAEFTELLDDRAAHYGFQLAHKSGGFGPSDHASFYAKQIPVLHFFTGTHSDYHRPSDVAEKLHVPGMRRIAALVSDLAVTLAEAPERPEYQEVAQSAPALGGGDRPYFGSIPDFSQDQEGYALTGVTKDGPAEKAGLKAGDIIVRLGDSRIGGLEDFDSALRKYKADEKVAVVVRRGDEELTLEVTLEAPR